MGRPVAVPHVGAEGSDLRRGRSPGPIVDARFAQIGRDPRAGRHRTGHDVGAGPRQGDLYFMMINQAKLKVS